MRLTAELANFASGYFSLPRVVVPRSGRIGWRQLQSWKPIVPIRNAVERIEHNQYISKSITSARCRCFRKVDAQLLDEAAASSGADIPALLYSSNKSLSAAFHKFFSNIF